MKKSIKIISLGLLAAMMVMTSCETGDDPGTGSDDENELPAITNLTLSVAEDVAVNTVIATIEATDADGDALIYSITSGNTGGEFALSSSGTLTVNEALDYETTTSYAFEVTVSDGEDSASADVVVNVTDVDEGTGGSADIVYDGTDFNIANSRLFDEGADDPNDTGSATHYDYNFVFTDGNFDSSNDIEGSFSFLLILDLFKQGTGSWSPGTFTIGSTSGDHAGIDMYLDSSFDERYEEKSGTITVALSGTTYTFTIDVVLKDNDGVGSDKTLTGSFDVDLAPVEEEESGEISYGGSSYSISNSRLIDEGPADPNDNLSDTHYDYYFVFTDGTFDDGTTDFVSSSTFVLSIDLFKSGTSSWSPGTYTVGSTGDDHPWVYMWRDLNSNNDDDNGDEFYVEKSGTVTVALSGNTYTFTIDVVLQDEDEVGADKTLTGSFDVDLTPV